MTAYVREVWERIALRFFDEPRGVRLQVACFLASVGRASGDDYFTGLADALDREPSWRMSDTTTERN